MRHPSGIPIALMLVLAGSGVSRAVRADETASPAPASESARTVPPDVVIPGVLSLDEALRLLRERGLDLLVADAAVRTAQGTAQTAAGIANPSVSVSDGPTFNYIITGPGCSGCSRQNISFGVGDNAATFDELVGKRGLRIEVARAVLAATRLGRATRSATSSSASSSSTCRWRSLRTPSTSPARSPTAWSRRWRSPASSTRG